MVFDCLGAGCHLCCVDTRMPLSLDDIGRLRGLGYRLEDFMVFCGGERRLRNIEGKCYFLEDDGCSVYEDRPAGCRFYPLVADMRGRVKVDPGCRYRDRFTVDNGDADRLRGFLKRLKSERRRELL